MWHLCSVPNLVQICYSHLRSTHICFRRLFDDVTRINFRFRLLVIWSSPRGHDASSHVICCNISLSSPKLLTFFQNLRWRPWPSWIFSLCEFGHFGVLIVRYLCSVPNLVQICVIITEIDALCFIPSFDDVTRINFRFRLLVTWSSPHGRGASSREIWCHPIWSYWYFPQMKDGGRRHLGFVWVSHGTTHESSFVACTSCKNFVVIG